MLLSSALLSFSKRNRRHCGGWLTWSSVPSRPAQRVGLARSTAPMLLATMRSDTIIVVDGKRLGRSIRRIKIERAKCSKIQFT